MAMQSRLRRALQKSSTVLVSSRDDCCAQKVSAIKKDKHEAFIGKWMQLVTILLCEIRLRCVCVGGGPKKFKNLVPKD